MSKRRAGSPGELAVFLVDATTGLPLTVVSNMLTINVGRWFGAVTPTVGQKLMTASIPVVIASDQGLIAVTLAQLPAALVGGRLDVNLGAWLGSTLPTVGQKGMASSIPVALASDQLIPTSSPLAVVVSGGANAIATLTLPAPGVGLFHYITYLSIVRVATAALAGGAILTVTSTNLPGAPTWRTGNTMAIVAPATGFVVLTDKAFASPLKSSVANTATTIVGPAAGAAVSWHMRAHYYTGP